MLNFLIVVVGFVLAATAEIFIGPLLYASCAQFAPKALKAELMGVIVMCYSLAYLVGGKLSQLVAIDSTMTEVEMLEVYRNGFLIICLMSVAVCCVAIVMKRFRFSSRVYVE